MVAYLQLPDPTPLHVWQMSMPDSVATWLSTESNWWRPTLVWTPGESVRVPLLSQSTRLEHGLNSQLILGLKFAGSNSYLGKRRRLKHGDTCWEKKPRSFFWENFFVPKVLNRKHVLAKRDADTTRGGTTFFVCCVSVVLGITGALQIIIFYINYYARA